MIRRLRSWAASRVLLVVRWWLTDRRAHKMMTMDGAEHHLGAGTFKGGYVSRDPLTGDVLGLVMFWLPEWSHDVTGFERVELTTMRKHPTLNEVLFYVPS